MERRSAWKKVRKPYLPPTSFAIGLALMVAFIDGVNQLL